MRARLSWVGVVLGLVACNSLNGVGDLHVVDCIDCADAEPSRDAGVVVPVQDTGTTVVKDQAAPDAGMDARLPPASYCAGVVFNVPFDDSATSVAGQMPALNDAAGFIAGKYKNGASLLLGVIFYDNPYATTATLLHNRDIGSVAMWVKPSFIPKTGDSRPLYKPRTGQGSAANNAGPGISLEGLQLHMYNQEGTQASATLDATKLAAVWQQNAFILVVGTWNRTGIPVGAPTLTITVSSSIGSATAETTAPWLPANDNSKFVRIGSQNAASQVLIDDLTLWNKQIGAQEIKDLFAASAAVAGACSL